MIDLPWLDRYPNESIEEGLKTLARLEWIISIGHDQSGWYVYAGEVLIFSTDSEEALKAFLYGLTLTYVAIDQAIVEAMVKEVKKYVD